MAKKKKNLISTAPPGSYVKNPIPSLRSSQLTFNFYFENWLDTTKVGTFTNKLNNQEEFGYHAMVLLAKIFPILQKEWDVKQHNAPGLAHVHPVDKAKHQLVRKIVEEIHGKQLEEEMELWQIGTVGGLRLICYYHASERSMYPLFVDYHHLIHPTSKHNQRDTKRFAFDPVKNSKVPK